MYNEDRICEVLFCNNIFSYSFWLLGQCCYNLIAQNAFANATQFPIFTFPSNRKHATPRHHRHERVRRTRYRQDGVDERREFRPQRLVHAHDHHPRQGVVSVDHLTGVRATVHLLEGTDLEDERALVLDAARLRFHVQEVGAVLVVTEAHRKGGISFGEKCLGSPILIIYHKYIS